MIYLVVHSEPPSLYYQGVDASYKTEIALRYPLLKEVGRINRPLNDEAPSLTVVLDNSDGTLTEEFIDPPIGFRVQLYRDAFEIFNGTIDDIKLDGDITVSIIS